MLQIKIVCSYSSKECYILDLVVPLAIILLFVSLIFRISVLTCTVGTF